MALTALTPGAKATTSPPDASATKKADSTGFGGMKTQDFIKILVAELSNQNPLDPIDNGKLLDQVSSINNMNTTQKLTDTLDSLNLSQGLSSASSMIGKSVTGKIGDKDVEGKVDKAVVQDGQVYLMVKDQKLPLSSVNEITS